MSAPIAIATWQTQRADQRSRDKLVARLAQLEQWQQERYKAAVELAELIERRELEIENIRRQLGQCVAS